MIGIIAVGRIENEDCDLENALQFALRKEASLLSGKAMQIGYDV